MLDAVLVPGPVFLELAQAAARDERGIALRAVEGFVIRSPLVLGSDDTIVQAHLIERSDGVLSFAIHSRSASSNGEWQLNVEGQLREIKVTSPATVSIAALRESIGKTGNGDDHYKRLAEVGIDLRPGFRTLHEICRRENEALVRIGLPVDRRSDSNASIHPVLLDGALQACGLLIPQPPATSDIYLLTGVDRISLAGSVPPELWCHACLRAVSSEHPHEQRADATLYALDGTAVGVLEGVLLRKVSRDTLERLVRAPADSIEDLFYELAWQPKPVVPAAAKMLVAPESLVPTLEQRFVTLADQNGLKVYDDLMPELDRLCREHIVLALRRLDFDTSIGRRFTLEAEITTLKVAPRYARLFGRLLDILAEDGLLRRHGMLFEVVAPFEAIEPAPQYVALLERFSGHEDELWMLRRCGDALSRLLVGDEDPLALIFSDGRLGEARRLYATTPFARTYNRILAELVAAVISDLPPTTPLRVLEIGAGTGATTAQVLPLLPGERTDYLFTDVSQVFLDCAAETFADKPFLRRALLDIERDPLEQGFTAESVDIVIAANVLHATVDLRQAVRNVARCWRRVGLWCCLKEWRQSDGSI